MTVEWFEGTRHHVTLDGENWTCGFCLTSFERWPDDTEACPGQPTKPKRSKAVKPEIEVMPPVTPEIGQTWRHVKTKGVYVVSGFAEDKTYDTGRIVLYVAKQGDLGTFARTEADFLNKFVPL